MATQDRLERQGHSRTAVCLACGAWGQVETVTRGSWRLEVVLWCLLAVPGIAYSAWRLAGRLRTCALCGSADLVPEDSAAGRQCLSRQAVLPAQGTSARSRLAAILRRAAPVSAVIVILALEVTLLLPPVRGSRALALLGGSALIVHFLSMLGLVSLRALRTSGI
jgi:hypothetical protein